MLHSKSHTKDGDAAEEALVQGMLRQASEELTGIFRTESALKEADTRSGQALRIALEKAEASAFRYKLIMEGTQDGLWDWDRKQRTIYFNGRLFQMLGFTGQPVLPDYKALFKRIHPEDRQQVLDCIYAAFRDKQNFKGEIRIQDIHGEYLYFHVRGKAFFDKYGQPARLAGTIMDITERKLAELALQVSQMKLMQIYEDLKQFTSTVSHDLQSPIRKSAVFLERLSDETHDLLSVQALDALERLKRLNREMHDLTTNLLNLTLTAQSASYRRHDLGRIVERVLSELKEEIDEKQAQIQVAPLPVIECDEFQMNMLLKNVINNALKYHKANSPPEIAITAKTPETGFCEIDVRDHGIGFQADQAQRLFNPFERLPTPHAYPGSGLGLAICKKIAERHQGSISATGMPDEGSTFTIKLPLLHPESG